MSDTPRHRKVLIIAKAYPPETGGVESYSEFIARAYLARGIEPVVVTSWSGPRGWHERHHPEGSIRVFNVGAGSQPTIFARFVGACLRLRLTQRFDWIHPTTWRPALAVMPFRGRVPVVLSVHGQEISCCPQRQRGVMSYVLRNVDLLITVSHATMQITRAALGGETPKGRWEVDFNGLSYLEEARQFERPVHTTEDRLRILSFCRLAERKNIRGCLDALARLRDAGITNFHYTIAGSGPLREQIAAQIVALGMQDLVQMIGYVKEEDIPDLYRNADIFLHPQTAAQSGADLEGFGLAIADSMSFGAAAVVGKDGGPADFVQNGVRGLVVDGNDIGQIAAALQTLLTDRARRNELAQAGRNWCLENLSWDRHVRYVVDALESQSK